MHETCRSVYSAAPLVTVGWVRIGGCSLGSRTRTPAYCTHDGIRSMALCRELQDRVSTQPRMLLSFPQSKQINTPLFLQLNRGEPPRFSHRQQCGINHSVQLCTVHQWQCQCQCRSKQHTPTAFRPLRGCVERRCRTARPVQHPP